MMGSITPLGERGRGRRWAPVVGAYVVGSALGGAAAGAAAGTLGMLARFAAPAGVAALWLAGAAALVAAALDAGLARRLPGPRRQVNEEWVTRYRGWVYGAGFGVQLGAGVTTIVTTAAIYALLVVAALSGAPRAGALIGVTFGLARALPLLAARRVRTPESLLRTDAWLRRWQPAAARLAVAAQAAVAVVLLAAAVSR